MSRDDEPSYRDDYPTCSRVLVELIVTGHDLVPSEVSSLLGIEPTTSRTRGEVSINSIGRRRIAKFGFWSLSSEGQVKSLDLRRHLDWLRERLLGREETLRLVRYRDGVSAHIQCIWWSRYGHGGPVIGPSQIRWMAELEVACGFEISFVEGVEESEDGAS